MRQEAGDRRCGMGDVGQETYDMTGCGGQDTWDRRRETGDMGHTYT